MTFADHWPESERGKTPAPPPDEAPVCKACGSRHLQPIPWCARNNEDATL
jgi:hypothetical protein